MVYVFEFVVTCSAASSFVSSALVRVTNLLKFASDDGAVGVTCEIWYEGVDDSSLVGSGSEGSCVVILFGALGEVVMLVESCWSVTRVNRCGTADSLDVGGPVCVRGLVLDYLSLVALGCEHVVPVMAFGVS